MPTELRGGPRGRGVYFLQAGEGGLVKIGYSAKIPGRVHALQATSPVQLLLRLVLPVHAGWESALHRRFAMDRRHGEWFHPSPELERFIESGGDDLKPGAPPDPDAAARRHSAKSRSFNHQALRRIRRARGYSSADLLSAALCERGVFISSGHLQRLESGRARHIKTEILVGLMALLECTADELLVRPTLLPPRETTNPLEDWVVPGQRRVSRLRAAEKRARRAPRALAV